MNRGIRWWDYIFLGLYAFAGLGMEVLYAFLLEPAIYHAQMQEWNTTQNIIHWTITCITWGIIAFRLCRLSKDKYEFDLLKTGSHVKAWQWICVLICVVFSLIVSYMDWNGFKIVKEYFANGPVKFVFQYIYYLFETVLFMLIIIFAQKALETLFKNPKIPYGGIICAVTWGLGHIFTKGSVRTGLLSALSGFMYGVVYLLLNRDIKKTYPVLFVMFML